MRACGVTLGPYLAYPLARIHMRLVRDARAHVRVEVFRAIAHADCKLVPPERRPVIHMPGHARSHGYDGGAHWGGYVRACVDALAVAVFPAGP
jgi:hypothetical protein